VISWFQAFAFKWVNSWFQTFAFKWVNLCRYDWVDTSVFGGDVEEALEDGEECLDSLVKALQPQAAGLCVALDDAHWSAVYA
jgi:hypothetical protein